MRWDSVVETSMEGYRRKPRRGAVHKEVRGVQDGSKRKDRNKGNASAKNQGESGGTLRYIRRVERKDENGFLIARPNGLRENAETVISSGGPGPARKKRYTSSREEEEDAQMCPCG